MKKTDIEKLLKVVLWAWDVHDDSSLHITEEEIEEARLILLRMKLKTSSLKPVNPVKRKSAPTLAQIRKKINDPRIELWDDKEAGCYRADMAQGWTIDELHGFVAEYYNGCHRTDARSDARDDLLARIEDSKIERCSKENENCRTHGCFLTD